ncbi:hypothetical protein B0T25DRAFT_516018 [Lasiosphaeria hispida]|uniref:Uncharacterized protein n=1 Tax=Lasiosphaeria hispida TaxID=260671 RepID=A0AAJ0MF33_9PEZI|nr:hypothetical protein B0T25DRAFT_516018 [Lasiosphaeria hispida]
MLAYRYGNLARCRTSTDLMTLFYAFDEYTDVEDELVMREMADILMDGMRNLDKVRPQGECFLGEMARHYWVIRHHTSGCLPSFTLVELELDIAEEIHYRPLPERMRDCALYLISAERARGHTLQNLVTVVMYQMDLGTQEAADWIGDWSDGVAHDFVTYWASLPSWGPEVNHQVKHGTVLRVRPFSGRGRCTCSLVSIRSMRARQLSAITLRMMTSGTRLLLFRFFDEGCART